jgi:hypothetical protein
MICRALWILSVFLAATVSVVSAQQDRFVPVPRSTSAFPDSTNPGYQRDSSATARSAKAAEPDKGEKFPVVKRQINYWEQIGLALGMMVFVLFIMTTADAWNPR